VGREDIKKDEKENPITNDPPFDVTSFPFGSVDAGTGRRRKAEGPSRLPGKKEQARGELKSIPLRDP
jgi:hypothetical protein